MTQETSRFMLIKSDEPGEEFKQISFAYGPMPSTFNNATIGSILRGEQGNLANIGTSLLRKAAGDQYVCESYYPVAYRVIGEKYVQFSEHKYIKDERSTAGFKSVVTPKILRCLIVEEITE